MRVQFTRSLVVITLPPEPTATQVVLVGQVTELRSVVTGEVSRLQLAPLSVVVKMLPVVPTAMQVPRGSLRQVMDVMLAGTTFTGSDSAEAAETPARFVAFTVAV